MGKLVDFLMRNHSIEIFYFIHINLIKLFSDVFQLYFTDRDFIASRRVALEKFLQSIVIHPLLRNSLLVRQFLDPRTYSQNFQGKAQIFTSKNYRYTKRQIIETFCHIFFLDIHLQNVTMCFRGVGNFEIVKPISGVGSRLKKDYFQVCDFGSDHFIQLNVKYKRFVK